MQPEHASTEGNQADHLEGLAPDTRSEEPVSYPQQPSWHHGQDPISCSIASCPHMHPVLICVLPVKSSHAQTALEAVMTFQHLLQVPLGAGIM